MAPTCWHPPSVGNARGDGGGQGSRGKGAGARQSSNWYCSEPPGFRFEKVSPHLPPVSVEDPEYLTLDVARRWDAVGRRVGFPPARPNRTARRKPGLSPMGKTRARAVIKRRIELAVDNWSKGTKLIAGVVAASSRKKLLLSEPPWLLITTW